LIKSGHLPAEKVGRNRLIKEEDLHKSKIRDYLCPVVMVSSMAARTSHHSLRKGLDPDGK
jgi:hypothetical protein